MSLIKKNIHGWEGYRWDSGELSLGLVPQLGGRIMSLRYRGEELFFVQEEHQGEVFEFSQLSGPKKDFGFRVWGGDKTWIAPEKAWKDNIPPLDLDAGKYEFDYDGKKVLMTSAVCRETGLRITREVELNAGNQVILTESIKNEASSPLRCGIWNVTQLLRPFDIAVPSAVSKVRLYDDEAFKKCRPEEYLQKEGPYTRISCRDREHFKFGCLAEEGKVTALRQAEQTILTLCKTFSLDPRATYAHGSTVEVYNSSKYDYCELEIHSPVRTLEPGESMSQQQQWQLGP